MRRRPAAGPGRLAAAAALALLLVGCTATTGLLAGGQVAPPAGGSPVPLNATDGWIVATGRAVDERGGPVADAMVFVVADPSQAEQEATQVGDVLEQTAIAAVTTGPDGTFTIRLVPAGPLQAIADANGGFVNLELQAFEDWPSDRPGRMGFFAFPLRVTATGFEDLPAGITLELRPVE